MNVCRRIAGVDSTKAPWSKALAHLVLPVVTDLIDATTRLAKCETVGDFRALRHDGRGVILNRSRDGGLICDRVGRRYRTFGVFHGNEGLDGVLPRPLVIGPSNSVGRCIVNATIGSGNEYCLCRKRIDDLNVLDLHEVGAEDAILQCGTKPTDTNLIGVGLVDLLVAVTQLIGRFATDSRVAIRVCRTALFDSDIGVRGPLGGL